jgi:hypothetical protein
MCCRIAFAQSTCLAVPDKTGRLAAFASSAIFNDFSNDISLQASHSTFLRLDAQESASWRHRA